MSPTLGGQVHGEGVDIDAALKMAKWAQRYCEIGLALTPTSPSRKGPCLVGWHIPDNAITDSKRALGYWLVNAAHGIAALLGPSGLVSLDIDDEQHAPAALNALGVDLEYLRETTPTIIGRHYRFMFKAPGVELQHRSATCPKQSGAGSAVLFELRAGSIADTLPPTIHPGTGTPYRWETPPQNGFPQLPPRLLEIWRDWENTNHAIRALCPWAPPPPSEPRPRREYSGPSVIEAFNAAHDTAAILEQHGYIRQGKRFASPGTSHDAGIVLLDSGKVFAITRAIPLLTSMRSMRSTCIGASITAATTPPQ